MANLNRVYLLGNLTRDPELRYTTSGTGICTLGLAVNRHYVVQGQERDEVCYVTVEVFGRQAETCNQYLRKGSAALVEGHLRYDEWDDRETGRKRSRLTVSAERVQFIGTTDHRSRSEGAAPADSRPAIPGARPPQAAPPPPAHELHDAERIDDIPF